MARIQNKDCFFCQRKINPRQEKIVDYNVIENSKILNYGRLRSKKQTKNCTKHHKSMCKVVKTSRILGLLPNKTSGIGTATLLFS